MKCMTPAMAVLPVFVIALASCSAGRGTLGELPRSNMIGKVTDEGNGWQVCEKHQCSTPASTTIRSGDGLNSGFGRMHFEIYAAKQSPSPHKLLGRLDAISVLQNPSVISFTLADGTLSGDVTGQPTKVVFSRGPNSNKPEAYCEFSTGKYIAVNYGLNVFELSGGEALCFDKEGAKHRITDETFSI